MRTLFWVSVFLFIALIIPITTAQEENTEEVEPPVIPYFTASNPAQKFNIPVPDGWRVIGSKDQPKFVTDLTDATIYAFTIDADDTLSGIQKAIQNLFPNTEISSRYQNELNIDGLDWTVGLFQKDAQTTITGYGHTRDDVIYVLLYDNREENDLFMLTIEHQTAENVQPDVEKALSQLYEGLKWVRSTPVELSNGAWTRTSYLQNDSTPLTIQYQARGRNTFIIVEEGDGILLDTVNKSFFSTIFGFFVTPNSAAFLHLGLGAIAILMMIFIGTYLVRQRNLQKDIAFIQQLQIDNG